MIFGLFVGTSLTLWVLMRYVEEDLFTVESGLFQNFQCDLQFRLAAIINSALFNYCMPIFDFRVPYFLCL